MVDLNVENPQQSFEKTSSQVVESLSTEFNDSMYSADYSAIALVDKYKTLSKLTLGRTLINRDSVLPVDFENKTKELEYHQRMDEIFNDRIILTLEVMKIDKLSSFNTITDKSAGIDQQTYLLTKMLWKKVVQVDCKFTQENIKFLWGKSTIDDKALLLNWYLSESSNSTVISEENKQQINTNLETLHALERERNEPIFKRLTDELTNQLNRPETFPRAKKKQSSVQTQKQITGIINKANYSSSKESVSIEETAPSVLIWEQLLEKRRINADEFGYSNLTNELATSLGVQPEAIHTLASEWIAVARPYLSGFRNFATDALKWGVENTNEHNYSVTHGTEGTILLHGYEHSQAVSIMFDNLIHNYSDYRVQHQVPHYFKNRDTANVEFPITDLNVAEGRKSELSEFSMSIHQQVTVEGVERDVFVQVPRGVDLNEINYDAIEAQVEDELQSREVTTGKDRSRWLKPRTWLKRHSNEPIVIQFREDPNTQTVVLDRQDLEKSAVMVSIDPNARSKSEVTSNVNSLMKKYNFKGVHAFAVNAYDTSKLQPDDEKLIERALQTKYQDVVMQVVCIANHPLADGFDQAKFIERVITDFTEATDQKKAENKSFIDNFGDMLRDFPRDILGQVVTRLIDASSSTIDENVDTDDVQPKKNNLNNFYEVLSSNISTDTALRSLLTDSITRYKQLTIDNSKIEETLRRDESDFYLAGSLVKYLQSENCPENIKKYFLEIIIDYYLNKDSPVIADAQEAFKNVIQISRMPNNLLSTIHVEVINPAIDDQLNKILDSYSNKETKGTSSFLARASYDLHMSKKLASSLLDNPTNVDAFLSHLQKVATIQYADKLGVDWENQNINLELQNWIIEHGLAESAKNGEGFDFTTTRNLLGNFLPHQRHHVFSKMTFDGTLSRNFSDSEILELAELLNDDHSEGISKMYRDYVKTHNLRLYVYSQMIANNLLDKALTSVEIEQFASSEELFGDADKAKVAKYCREINKTKQYVKESTEVFSKQFLWSRKSMANVVFTHIDLAKERSKRYRLLNHARSEDSNYHQHKIFYSDVLKTLKPVDSQNLSPFPDYAVLSRMKFMRVVEVVFEEEKLYPRNELSQIINDKDKKVELLSALKGRLLEMNPSEDDDLQTVIFEHILLKLTEKRPDNRDLINQYQQSKSAVIEDYEIRRQTNRMEVLRFFGSDSQEVALTFEQPQELFNSCRKLFKLSESNFYGVLQACCQVPALEATFEAMKQDLKVELDQKSEQLNGRVADLRDGFSKDINTTSPDLATPTHPISGEIKRLETQLARLNRVYSKKVSEIDALMDQVKNSRIVNPVMADEVDIQLSKASTIPIKELQTLLFAENIQELKKVVQRMQSEFRDDAVAARYGVELASNTQRALEMLPPQLMSMAIEAQALQVVKDLRSEPTAILEEGADDFGRIYSILSEVTDQYELVGLVTALQIQFPKNQVFAEILKKAIGLDMSKFLDNYAGTTGLVMNSTPLPGTTPNLKGLPASLTLTLVRMMSSSSGVVMKVPPMHDRYLKVFIDSFLQNMDSFQEKMTKHLEETKTAN